MSKYRESLWLPVLTLLAGLIFMLLPVPDWLEQAWPYWVALVLAYWVLEGRFRIGLGHAFLVGLLVDVVSASLLGQHALGLVILTYLITQFRSRIRFFPPWQQALSILILLLNDRIITLWILLLVGERNFSIGFWIAPLIGALLWPWVFLLIDRIRRAARKKST